MSRSTTSTAVKGSLVLFLFTILVSVEQTNAFNGFEIFPRSDACPTSYDSCGGNVPSDFCCPSTSTCLVLDNDTTALCCPSGSSCDYISPITCDIQEQNATAYPKASVKTTLLGDSLPTCGDECCPFGYTCENDNLCHMTNTTTTSTTTASSTATSTTSTSTSASASASASASTTTDLSASGATFTAVSSGSSVSAASLNADSTSSSNSTTATACPAFPSKAVVAGFFPGVLFGAIAALLISTCIRHRAEKKHLAEIDQDTKASAHNWSSRSSSGAVLGISSPIASEDASYRTDFLLRNPDSKRSSMSSRSMRSMMNRSSSRVRSLFSTGMPGIDKDVPPLPTTATELPVQEAPVTPPRQREPSTESIKVYSPPAVFMQSRRFLGPEPYPSRIARPSTTFTDLVQAVGFNPETKGDQSFKVHEVRKIT